MEGKLPYGWVSINLKESVDFRKGKKPEVLSSEYFEGLVPYMDIQGLEKGIVSYYADSDSAKYFKENDVVIVWDGSRSGLILKPKQGAIGSTLGALSPIGYNTLFLYYFLSSHYEVINSKARGVGIPHVDPTYLWNLELPLPPLAEQERIVAKLDTLFAQHELMKKALERIPKLLKELRQQVLTQAVTGKLTEKWKEGKELENVSQYFKRITEDLSVNYQLLLEKASQNRQTKPRNQTKNKISDKGDPVLSDIPEQWKYLRAEELCYLITDGVHFKPEYIETGVKFLSVKNVRPFKINIENCKYISEEDHLKYIQRCNPENGDLLYTKVGATYGYAAKVNLNCDFSIFVSLALIKPSKLINSTYLELLFNSTIIFNQANYKVSGIGVPDLHLIEIRDFKIPLPTYLEQEEIVRRVESLFAKADVIAASYKKLKEKIDSLPQALLHKAFTGELVAQLPTDGDARDLLEEIKALKGASAKLTKMYKTTHSLNMVAED